MVFETKSAAETQKIARVLADELLKVNPKKHALVLALTGDLGSGKTTFVQGFARGLSVCAKIKSPTFLIIKNYKLMTKNYKLFTHIDAYRLKKPSEILALGFKDLVRDPRNIIAIEWARHIKKILPKEHIDIKFEHPGREKSKKLSKNFEMRHLDIACVYEASTFQTKLSL